MVGSWRSTVIFGGVGFLLIFLLSLSHNPFGTSVVRGFYACIVFMLLAVAAGFVLGQMRVPAAEGAGLGEDEKDRGAVLDLTTPDEGDSLSEMMREQWTGGKDDSVKGFQPLQPKRLVSLDNPNPEEVVQAIRRLKDE